MPGRLLDRTLREDDGAPLGNHTCPTFYNILRASFHSRSLRRLVRSQLVLFRGCRAHLLRLKGIVHKAEPAPAVPEAAAAPEQVELEEEAIPEVPEAPAEAEAEPPWAELLQEFPEVLAEVLAVVHAGEAAPASPAAVVKEEEEGLPLDVPWRCSSCGNRGLPHSNVEEEQSSSPMVAAKRVQSQSTVGACSSTSRGAARWN